MQGAVAGTGVLQFAGLRLAQERLQASARREVREQVQQRPARGLWRAVRLSERLRPPEVQHAE